MIHLNVILTVNRDEDIETVKNLLAEQGRLSRAEPGCARFEVYHSTENRRVFLLNEWWENQAAVDAHRKAKAYTTIYRPKVIPMVERVPHPAVLVE